MANVELYDAVKIAAVILSAGGGSWFGMKARMNGTDTRMKEGFTRVHEAQGRIESKLDKLNGQVQRNTTDIAVLKDRTSEVR